MTTIDIPSAGAALEAADLGIAATCRCSHEAGDSDCPAHPTCAYCGESQADSMLFAALKTALNDINILHSEMAGTFGTVCGLESSVGHLISLLDEARTDLEQLRRERDEAVSEVDHARLNQRTDDERELWEAGKAERDQLRAQCEAMRAVCEAACTMFDRHSGHFECVESELIGTLEEAIDIYLAGGAK